MSKEWIPIYLETGGALRVKRSDIEGVVLETLMAVTALPNWMTDGPLSVNVLRVRFEQMRAAAREATLPPDTFREDVQEFIATLRGHALLPEHSEALAKVLAHLEKR